MVTLTLKSNPVGVDAVIDYAMRSLETLNWNAGFTIYPRCYSKITDSLKTIEYRNEASGEQEALSVAECNKLFFLCENDMIQVGNGYFETTVSLYGIVDLVEVARQDSEVWRDVMEKVKSVPYFKQADRIVTGFDRVFQRYNYQQGNDMYPYHCFRIDIPTQSFSIEMIACH